MFKLIDEAGRENTVVKFSLSNTNEDNNRIVVSDNRGDTYTYYRKSVWDRNGKKSFLYSRLDNGLGYTTY